MLHSWWWARAVEKFPTYVAIRWYMHEWRMLCWLENKKSIFWDSMLRTYNDCGYTCVLSCWPDADVESYVEKHFLGHMMASSHRQGILSIWCADLCSEHRPSATRGQSTLLPCTVSCTVYCSVSCTAMHCALHSVLHCIDQSWYAGGEPWVVPRDRSRRSPPSSLQGGHWPRETVSCHQMSSPKDLTMIKNHYHHHFRGHTSQDGNCHQLCCWSVQIYSHRSLSLSSVVINWLIDSVWTDE